MAAVADLAVSVRIAAEDAASGPIRGIAGVLEGLGAAAASPLRALGGVTSALGAVGLAAGGLSTIGSAVASVFGVGLASSMETVRAQLMAMTKDGAAADDILRQIRAEADKTPFAFEEMARATAGLLPAAKTSGVALQDLVKQAEILAASHPEQGLEGAAFALREALSGDFTSVIERFDLPRQRLNELKAQGVPAVKAIQTAMREMGLDETLVANLAGTMTGRWSTFLDTIAGFKTRLGAGLFEGLKAGLLGAQALLEKNGQAIGAALENAGAAVGRFVSDAIPRLLDLGQRAIPLITGAVGALVDLFSSGDVGLFADDLREAFDVDIGVLVEPIRSVERAIGGMIATAETAAVRVKTFFEALAGGATLAASVNRAFGDLIPFSLNQALDAVDAAFGRVRDAAVGLVATVQEGGLAALWAQVTQAMSDFAPTGERIQGALAAVGDAIRALVPQPLQDFVAGLVSAGTSAANGATPLGVLATVVNTVSAAFAGAVAFLKENTVLLYASAGAVTALGTAWAITNTVQAATAALTAARVAVLALNVALAANPVGLVVVALGALAGALVYAYENSETFRDAVDRAFAALKQAVSVAMSVAVPLVTAFATAVTSIGPTVARVVGDVVGFFANLRQGVTTASQAAQAAVTGAWTALAGAVAGAVSGLVSTVASRFDDMTRGVQDAQHGITTYLQDQWTAAIPEDIRDGLAEVARLLGVRFNEFLTNVSTSMAAIARAVQTGWATVQSATSTALAVVRGVVDAAWKAILAFVQNAVAPIQAAATAVWDAVKTTTQTLLDEAAKIVDAAWNAFTGVIAATTGPIVGAAAALWEAVKARTAEVLATVEAVVAAWGEDVVAWITALVGGTLAAAKSLGQSIVDGIVGALRAGAQAVVDAVGQIVRDAIDAAKKALGARSPSREFAKVGETIPQGLAVGIKQAGLDAVAEVRRVISAVYDAATGAALDPRGRAPGATIVAAIAEGVRDAVPPVLLEELFRLADRARDAAKTALDDLGLEPIFHRLMQAIGATVDKDGKIVADKFSGWIGDVIKKRTELLWRWNFDAFKRGEGTKVLPGLEDATRDFLAKQQKLVVDAALKMKQLTERYDQDIADAREKAADDVAKAVSDARDKIADIDAGRALQAQIEARKKAFAEMQRIQREGYEALHAQAETALKREEDLARIAFQRNLALSRVGVDQTPGVTAASAALDAATEEARIAFQEQRAIDRATTEAQRDEAKARAKDAREALKDRLDEADYVARATRDLALRLQREQIEAQAVQARRALDDRQAEELAVETETATLRNQIAQQAAMFERQVAQQTAMFEEQLDFEEYRRRIAAIEEERDARIAAVNTELAEREAALTDAYVKERNDLIVHLRDQLEDLKKEYLDKVKEAFQQAGVDLVDFYDMIYGDLAKRVESTNGEILQLIADLANARASLGPTPSYGFQPGPSLPDTTRIGAPGSASGAAPAPASTAPARPVVDGRGPVQVTVNALSADINSADLARELWRQGVLVGG